MRIPYELIEKVFGTFIADNFREITTILTIAGILILLIRISVGGGRR